MGDSEVEITVAPEVDSGAPVSVQGGRVFIYAPDAIGSLTPTARCILDELKDWHRRVERHGSKEVHPSYLLTLDKVLESLAKFNNLSTQAKSEQAIFHALKQIIDFDHRGEHRVAYVYPYLIRTGNKASAKIALVAPQKESKTDVYPYRNSCFKFSTELIDQYFQNRSKRQRSDDDSNLSAILFVKNVKGQEFFYPKLGSLEAEMNSIIRRGFAPYPYIPMRDFLDDFISYGLEKTAITTILDDYHIIVDELELNDDGSFKKTPELWNQIKLHTDGLIRFSKNFIAKLAKDSQFMQFTVKLDSIVSEYNPVEMGENLESWETAAKNIVAHVKTFPFEKFSTDIAKKIKEAADDSIKILEKLLLEKENITYRHSDNLLTRITKSLNEKIPEWTRTSQTLFSLSIEEEVLKVGVTEEAKKADLVAKVKEFVEKEFAFEPGVDGLGHPVLFAVDPGYMALVLHKLGTEKSRDSEAMKMYMIASRINDQLSNPKHPKLNMHLKPDQVVRLMGDIRSSEEKETEERRSDEFKSRFNTVAGVLSFSASLVFFVMISYYIKSVFPIFFGIPVSAVLGFIFAILYREKTREEIREDLKNSGKYSASVYAHEQMMGNQSGGGGSSSGGSGKDDGDELASNKKLQDILRAADNYIFPKKFNKATDRVLDLKTIRDRIYHNLDEIRRKNLTLSKEKDDDKVASTVEYALMQACATISVPEDIAYKGLPSSIVVTRNDLKTPLFREQIANIYRDEMNKKKFDKKLVKYYTFLINTFEMEYYKYLPKKRM